MGQHYNEGLLRIHCNNRSTTSLEHENKESNDYNHYWSINEENKKLKTKKQTRSTLMRDIFNSSLPVNAPCAHLLFQYGTPYLVSNTPSVRLNWIYFEQVTETLLPELSAAPEL